MGFFDEIFDKSNMKAVMSQVNAGKEKMMYTIVIKTPVNVQTDDRDVMNKVKYLLFKNKVDFEVIEEPLN